MYWLDNVSLLPVSVALEEPQEISKLFYNATMRDSLFSLAEKKYHDLDGNPVTGFITLPPFSSRILVLDDATGTNSEVDEPGDLPLTLSISPNPCNPSATISIRAAAGQRMTLDCFDLRGCKIATLFDGKAPKTGLTLAWKGRTDSGAKVGSGVYVLRLNTGDKIVSRKLFFVQ